MRKLILFDIDGTLIRSRGIGNSSLGDVLRRVFDVKESVSEKREGETYKAILYDTLLEKGFTKKYIDSHYKKATKVLDDFGKRYIDKEGVELLPGVKELLDELMNRKAVLAVCSGNSAGVGWAKIEKAGIRDYFSFGAFGDSESKRWRLVQAAQFQAEKETKMRCTGKNIVIVGDTPHDIIAGQPFSARSIAVCTGIYPKEELKKENPSHIFKDLSETEDIIRAIYDD